MARLNYGSGFSCSSEYTFREFFSSRRFLSFVLLCEVVGGQRPSEDFYLNCVTRRKQVTGSKLIRGNFYAELRQLYIFMVYSALSSCGEKLGPSALAESFAANSPGAYHSFLLKSKRALWQAPKISMTSLILLCTISKSHFSHFKFTKFKQFSSVKQIFQILCEFFAGKFEYSCLLNPKFC